MTHRLEAFVELVNFVVVDSRELTVTDAITEYDHLVGQFAVDSMVVLQSSCKKSMKTKVDIKTLILANN